MLKEKAVTGNQFKEAEKPQTFLGKARNFAAKIVGGGEVARGAGLALAAPSVQRNIDETIDNLTSQQTQIIKELREKRAKGEDTTALTTALKLNRDELRYCVRQPNINSWFVAVSARWNIPNKRV